MVTIRTAVNADIERISQINNSSMPENYVYDTFAKHISIYKMTFVAEKDNAIVGYIMGTIEDKVEAHVTSIAVDEASRGMKIGQKLMIHFLLAAKKLRLKSCSLQVRVDNEVALHVYKRLNFQPIREHANYYSDGTAAYFMRRQL